MHHVEIDHVQQLVDNFRIFAEEQRLKNVHKELFVEGVKFNASGVTLVCVEVDADFLLFLLGQRWVVLDWGLALLFLVFFLEHDSCLEKVLVVFRVEKGMQVDCCFLYHHLCRLLGQTQQAKQPCILLLNPLCLVLHLESLATPY